MKIPVNSHVFVRTVVLALGLAGAVMPSVASAQPATSTGAILTLTDALTLARRNNPDLQKSLNARRTAAANTRAATGAFLPSLQTSIGGGYREGRQTFFQGQGFGSTNDQLSTDVSASASMNFSMATLNDRRAVKANQEATEFDIQAAEQTLRNNVTMQYLTALQQQARAQLQDTLLVTTEAQLQLAQARLQVGSGTQLDVQRAEVTHGQQRVAALNARNQTAIEIVRLSDSRRTGGARNAARFHAPATDAHARSAAGLDNARRENPMLDAARTRESSTSFGGVRGVPTFRRCRSPPVCRASRTGTPTPTCSSSRDRPACCPSGAPASAARKCVRSRARQQSRRLSGPAVL